MSSLNEMVMAFEKSLSAMLKIGLQSGPVILAVNYATSESFVVDKFSVISQN